MINNKEILLKPSITIRRRLPVNFISEDVNDFKDGYLYNTYNSYLRLISNAKVSPDSVVYQNGFLINETLASNEYRSYYRLRHLLKKILIAKRINLNDNQKYLMVTDYWSEGHFHWFTEALPKLLCIAGIANEFVLLLPDKAYIKSIGFESLKRLKLDFEDIILMKETEFYQIKNFYYISRISRSGQMHNELMKGLRKSFVSDRKIGTNRIYISRENAVYRKVLNEKELYNLLLDYGFEMLHAEDFDLTSQIDIFSSCGMLLGIHGAGLTNCIFMPPESNVIELRRKEIRTNNGYWHLADSLDHKYYYYNGIPDSEKTIIGKGCNLTIPIDDFENIILKRISKLLN